MSNKSVKIVTLANQDNVAFIWTYFQRCFLYGGFNDVIAKVLDFGLEVNEFELQSCN